MRTFFETGGINWKERAPLLLAIGIIVLVVLFLNRLLTALLPNEYRVTELIIFNTVQFSVLVFVGWATVRFFRKSILSAAAIAGVAFAVDYFGLRTMCLVLIFSGSEHTISYSMYSSLAWSFLFFVPIAMLLGAIGGFIAKKRKMD